MEARQRRPSTNDEQGTTEPATGDVLAASPLTALATPCALTSVPGRTCLGLYLVVGVPNVSANARSTAYAIGIRPFTTRTYLVSPVRRPTAQPSPSPLPDEATFLAMYKLAATCTSLAWTTRAMRATIAPFATALDVVNVAIPAARLTIGRLCSAHASSETAVVVRRLESSIEAQSLGNAGVRAARSIRLAGNRVVTGPRNGPAAVTVPPDR